MATYTLDEVMGAKTYSLEEVMSDAPMSAGDRFKRGLRDPIDAGAQLLTNILPEGVVKAGDQFNNWLADKTGLVGRLPEGGVDQQVREAEAAYVSPEGVDWARMGGNILSPANLAIASKIPAAASLAGRVGAGAIGGAAMGALQPVADGNFADEKLKQAGLGAAVGGALPMLTGAAARVIKPRASDNASLQLLQKEGVNPTVGQAMGGRLNALEEKVTSIPILGDMISVARKGANTGLEKAAFNRALKPIGAELPKGLTGRDAVVFTENALKDKYDDVLNKIGAIRPDGSYKMKVASLRNMVEKLKAPKAAKQEFYASLSRIDDVIDENGVITSEAFKQIESDLGRRASNLASVQDNFKNDVAPAVKQLQQELRNMLKRQAGDQADELAKSNTAWANFKRVQNAAARVGAEEGSFTPAQLQNAVRATDRSKDKAAFARGNALMQDLSEAGKTVLGSKTPNSFTTDRALVAGGALGSYFVNPVIPAGLLGGAALYSQPAQKALVGMVSRRPELAQPVSDLVRRSSPYLLPAAQGLLNYQNN